MMPHARPVMAVVGALLVGFLCLLTILWPGYFALVSMIDAPEIAPELLDASALGRTILWSLSVAVATIPVGLVAAHCLGRVLKTGRGLRLAVAACVVPLCVPGYAIFWCWWQSFGPGSSIGAMALESGSAVLLRQGVLLLALVCWSWPLLAWPLALAHCHRSEASVTLAALDGASRWQRFTLRWRAQRSALLLGVGLIVFVTAGATISFDLAQVVTIGFELRALDATGVAPGALLRLALPSLVIAMLGALVLFSMVRWSGRRWQAPLALRATAGAAPARGAWACLLLLVGVTALLPIIFAFGGLGSLDPGLFWSLHAEATLRTVFAALLDGLLAALLGGALFVQIAQGGPLLRFLGLALGLLWIGVSLLPSIAICAALTAAFNGDQLGPLVYDSGGVLLIGHLARTGGIAAAIALFLASSESRSASAVRRLDPPRLRAIAPRLRSTMLLAFAVAAVFSLGELVITARLVPPGDQRIATTLLNAMHYQRPDIVLFALAGLVVCGWGLAALVAFGVPRVSRTSSIALLTVMLIAFPGCDDDDDVSSNVPGSSVPPVPTEVLVGAPGRGPALFEFPRGIALDAARNRFYVVDKTSRVQRFSLDDGALETWWQLPEWTVGKPVGISVAPDGRVFVPDTHYHRIIVFDPEGNELQRFGRFGTGPGEFVYPTDIAFAPDGTFYIAEYGTNDRIQVFSHEGTHLRDFGRFGREDGAFARPQSIALSPERGELYVADTCNHRIGVHALDGTWLRSLAGPGTEPGRLSYPHGLELLPDGTLLVSEIGTDRVQRLDAQTGESLGTWGGSGFERGRLKTPWGVASDGERLLVLDSGNARVQIGPLPSTSGPSTSEPHTSGPSSSKD